MSAIRKFVADIVAEVKQTTVAEADHEKSLKELGMDSLDVANILLAVEEKFDLKIPDSDVQGLSTLDAIAKYVESRVRHDA